MRRTALVLLALVGALALAAPAGARTAHVSGEAIGKPVRASGGLSVPVVMSGSSQRRVRSESAVARFVVPVTPKLPGPGGLQLDAAKLRAGDEIQMRTRVPRKRARKGVLTLRGKSARVMSRESVFSTDELTAFVGNLANEVAGLSGRLNTLVTELSTLRTQLLGIQSGLQGGGTGLPSDALASLQAQVAGLLSRLTALELTVTGLQGTVNGLAGNLTTVTGDLTALQGTVGSLQGTVTALGTQVGTLQGTVNVICGALIVC